MDKSLYGFFLKTSQIMEEMQSISLGSADELQQPPHERNYPTFQLYGKDHFIEIDSSIDNLLKKQQKISFPLVLEALKRILPRYPLFLIRKRLGVYCANNKIVTED